MTMMFVLQNKIIFDIQNYNYVTGLKKKRIFNILPVVMGCSPGCLPRQQIFRKISKLFYYFYMINDYVRYNNIMYCIVLSTSKTIYLQ